MKTDLFQCVQEFNPGPGRRARLYSLPQLEKRGLGRISRMPVSLRIVLESLVRNLDGERIRESDVRALAGWEPNAPRKDEIPFIVARVLLQDFTGVPLLVDLAAMRSAVGRQGKDPKVIEPLVPVDLVVDHSVQVDVFGSPQAFQRNLETEFARNRPRYEFLKWGTGGFKRLKIIPPGTGICHQVNLEYLAHGVLESDGVYYPDTLVGTDSHTTMINGLGIVGWGVGGIEAEAGMLGQPVYFLMPDVVGVHLSGALRPGVTATDLVLHITELLRRHKVVGKFVEFHGDGAASLTVTDRATISNMSPEYGATIGFFPVDEQSCRYLESTGRSAEQVQAFRAYYQAQGMFGMPRRGDCDYTTLLELDLASVEPAVSGPRRPQDRIALPDLKERFQELLQRTDATGYGRSREASEARHPVDGECLCAERFPGGGRQDPASLPDGRSKNTSTLTEYEMMNNRPTPDPMPAGAERFPESVDLGDGDVLIAAITSCTNTSNPSVMLAAGLLAKKAVERGLTVNPKVKTSLAPGSRVVTDYLEKTGLQPYLDRLGFELVGYGCTTCIGNSGPLAPVLEEALGKHGIVAASVLSGNRNFEARIHQSIKANFLMSPPLVVAFALAGRVGIDLTREPLGLDPQGREVFLRDVWPAPEEIQALMGKATDPEAYRALYRDAGTHSPLWNEIPTSGGTEYPWDPASSYIREPPYFEGFSMQPRAVEDLSGARVLAIFGDSVTTDHISPAGAITAKSPAAKYLEAQGIGQRDFNSYGSRRGNHEVMLRGTFANVRIKNLMVPGVEGGVTRHQPDGQQLSIYDAAMKYQADGIPLVVFAGQDYGAGSSRDWAAKGTMLLGVRAVVAQSFERIHRSNLVGMGVLPCQFKEGQGAATLGLDGSETVDFEGLEQGLAPGKELLMRVRRADGREERVPVTARIDTPIEVEYYRHGGILPYVLRQLIG